MRHPLIKEISVHLPSNDLYEKGGVAERSEVTMDCQFILSLFSSYLQVCWIFFGWLHIATKYVNMQKIKRQFTLAC